MVINLSLFCSSSFRKNPELKHQVGVDLRLVSHSLAWCPVINSAFAANSHSQSLASCTTGTQAYCSVSVLATKM